MYRRLDGGVLLESTVQAHENRLYVKKTDVAAPHVYRANQNARSVRDQTRSDVRMAFQMTPSDFAELGKKYPAIHQGNQYEQRRCWELIAKENPHLLTKSFEGKYFSGH